MSLPSPDMTCQPQEKGLVLMPAPTRAMLLEGGQPSMCRGEQPGRGAPEAGQKECLDGNVPSYHKVLDERMGIDGGREDLKDWK